LGRDNEDESIVIGGVLPRGEWLLLLNRQNDAIAV